jgi:hypothetical protein
MRKTFIAYYVHVNYTSLPQKEEKRMTLQRRDRYLNTFLIWDIPVNKALVPRLAFQSEKIFGEKNQYCSS